MVTLPLLSTFTTCSLADCQLTVWVVALAGSTVAINCTRASPCLAVMLAGVTVTDCTGIGVGACASIFTCTVKVFSPALASIVVSPAAIMVTLPLLSTFTTCSLADCQLTVGLVALAGSTVAVNCTGASPTLAVILAGVTVTDCTGTTCGCWVTTTCRAAVFPFAELAISWVVPELTPTTLPSSILATASLSDAQLIVLSLALSGVTVAVGSSPRSPTFKLSSVKESATVCTGISKTAWIVSSCVMLERLYVLPVPTNCPLWYQPLKLVLGRFGTWKEVLPPLCTLCCSERAKIPPLVSTICRVMVYLGICANTALIVRCCASIVKVSGLAVPKLWPFSSQCENSQPWAACAVSTTLSPAANSFLATDTVPCPSCKRFTL